VDVAAAVQALERAAAHEPSASVRQTLRSAVEHLRELLASSPTPLLFQRKDGGYSYHGVCCEEAPPPRHLFRSEQRIPEPWMRPSVFQSPFRDLSVPQSVCLSCMEALEKQRAVGRISRA